MTVQIDVWSDFVCPWCYAAALNLKELAETKDVSIRWRSFELRPAGSPPMDPAYLQHIETDARPRFNAIMKDQHGIDINVGPFGIKSRDALVGEKVARAYGLGDEYHEAVTRAYWDRAQNIEDRAVLRAAAESVGIDGEAFLRDLDDPQFDLQVTEDVMTAQQLGLNSVPALVFGMRYLVSGAQPADVLRQVVERIEAEGLKTG